MVSELATQDGAIAWFGDYVAEFNYWLNRGLLALTTLRARWCGSDRSFEQQRSRASGLTLVTAAIVLWNTIYLERAVRGLSKSDSAPEAQLLKFLSPLSWEHINLTADYTWRSNQLPNGRFRPLRTSNHA